MGKELIPIEPAPDKKDWHPWLKLPLKFRDLMTVMKFNWGYDTEPEPHLGGRSVYLPRGKVLGG